jgi:hypothetical protein
MATDIDEMIKLVYLNCMVGPILYNVRTSSKNNIISS